MQITIPPNCRSFPAQFFPWIIANGVVPDQVDDSKEVQVTDHGISGTTQLQTPFLQPITIPMPEGMAAEMISLFGVEETKPAGDPVVLDDMASLIEQLRDARAAEKAAKERAEEARDQILARMREAGSEIGTVGGAPAVKWEIRSVNRFETARFRKDHADLATEYTKTSEENRLNLL